VIFLFYSDLPGNFEFSGEMMAWGGVEWKWEEGAEDEGSNYFEENARKGEGWKQSRASKRASEQAVEQSRANNW